jgi:hypothetical protein
LDQLPLERKEIEKFTILSLKNKQNIPSTPTNNDKNPIKVGLPHFVGRCPIDKTRP